MNQEHTENKTVGKTEMVTFDVGGKVYRVSRSLIDQYSNSFLGTLVSDTWQTVDSIEQGGQNENGTQSPIFIDRDGDRFAYVLDFLRYGQIVLPYHISREMFLLDLDFLGIANVPATLVTTGRSKLGHMNGIQQLMKAKAEAEKELEEIHQNIEAALFASKCFSLVIANGGSTTFDVDEFHDVPFVQMVKKVQSDKNLSSKANECLQEFGLNTFTARNINVNKGSVSASGVRVSLQASQSKEDQGH